MNVLIYKYRPPTHECWGHTDVFMHQRKIGCFLRWEHDGKWYFEHERRPQIPDFHRNTRRELIAALEEAANELE